MVTAGDFKNGITIEYEGNIYQIIEFQHVKPGKGAAFVRTKLKNIKSGGVIEKSFRPTEKFNQARIERKDMQYLYNDGDLYNFMDAETYDQIALSADQIGDALKFVKENETVKVCSHNGEVFSVEPPLNVTLEVTETEPGVKGDTATGATKPAIVETGAQIMVPLFVNTGYVLQIYTRTGEYLKRVLFMDYSNKPLKELLSQRDVFTIFDEEFHKATWLDLSALQDSDSSISDLRADDIVPSSVLDSIELQLKSL